MRISLQFQQHRRIQLLRICERHPAKSFKTYKPEIDPL